MSVALTQFKYLNEKEVRGGYQQEEYKKWQILCVKAGI